VSDRLGDYYAVPFIYYFESCPSFQPFLDFLVWASSMEGSIEHLR
jgi:hypothetical protein